MRHLLLIRTSALGDVIQTFYVLSDLRRAFPQLTIDWCVDQRFSEFARLHPAVSRVIEFPTRQWRGAFLRPSVWVAVIHWLRLLRGIRADVTLDLQGMYKSAAVGWFSGAGVRAGPAAVGVSEFGAQFFYSKRVAITKAEGLATRARFLAGSALGYDPFVYPIQSGVMCWPKKAKADRVFFMVGSSRPEKTWLPDRWALLADRVFERFGQQVELLWGSDPEKAAAMQISEQAGKGACKPAPKKYSARELQEAFLSASAVVGADTGLSHLAVALGTPTILLFSTTHAVRYTHPELSNQFFVEHANSSSSTEEVYAHLEKILSDCEKFTKKSSID